MINLLLFSVVAIYPGSSVAQNCGYNPDRTNLLKDIVEKSLGSSSIRELTGASSKVYILPEIAVIKPKEGSLGFQAPEKQALAKRLDFGTIACLPDGYIDEMNGKTAYIQSFVPNTTPLVELHPEFSTNRTLGYNFRNNPILDQVPLEEFQKIATLDILLYNEDRHPGNILVSYDESGSPHLAPIDTDMILPGKFSKPPYTGLFFHPRAQEPMSATILQWIESLDPEKIYETVIEEGLSENQARQAKILAIMLKELAPTFSIAMMHEFMATRLPLLIEIGKKQPPEEFWTYFQEGLEREKEIAAAKKPRHIRFGTTYVEGNPNRDKLSQIVSANQQEYAKYWGLEGRAVTTSLVKSQCSSREGKEAVDCVPYWNKIAVLRNWLDEPASDKEEWYILADDDMPVTNMNINPYEAIDLLREGQDASVLIVRDIVNWRGDRNLSVNTGLLIVRKDQKSKEFIERLWAKRNNPTSSSSPICPTLGTCKNQEVLHEQEAFARVLSDDRSLLSDVVKVVDYRKSYGGKEIALNTFRRHGCFVRTQEGWGEFSFSYRGDPEEGFWKPGDWMGQTAGVPIDGKDCATGAAKEFRQEYLEFMLRETVSIGSKLKLQKSIDLLSKLSKEAQIAALERPDKLIQLQENGITIDLLSKLSEEAQIAALERPDKLIQLQENGISIDLLSNLSEEAQEYALFYANKLIQLQENEISIDLLSKLSEEAQIAAIYHTENLIQLQENEISIDLLSKLSEKAQRTAIYYPDKLIQLQENGISIDLLLKLPEEVQQTVILYTDKLIQLQENGISIDLLLKLPEEVQRTAIYNAENLIQLQESGISIDLLSKLSEEAQRAAIYRPENLIQLQENGISIDLLLKLPEEAQRAAIYRPANLIQFQASKILTNIFLKLSGIIAKFNFLAH